ncbi:MAG: DUF1326 domain-containing protein, partial [Gemmataceae bacterium]|nr:DUF1326 domain-containing protein [Gemmataceae bacterium]
IVDARADPAQRQALIRLARRHGGDLVRNVIAVQTARVDLALGKGKEEVVAHLVAGDARIKTRPLDPVRDQVCGGEHEFYPPLSRNVKVQAAVATEHSFTGKGFEDTWRDVERRSAYVGRFEIP